MANLFDETMTPAEVLHNLDQMAQTLEGPAQQAVIIAIDGLQRFEELVDLVRKMRRAQRNYFADQTRENLIKSKELEKKVDAIIKE